MSSRIRSLLVVLVVLGALALPARAGADLTDPTTTTVADPPTTTTVPDPPTTTTEPPTTTTAAPPTTTVPPPAPDPRAQVLAPPPAPGPLGPDAAALEAARPWIRMRVQAIDDLTEPLVLARAVLDAIAVEQVDLTSRLALLDASTLPPPRPAVAQTRVLVPTAAAPVSPVAEATEPRAPIAPDATSAVAVLRSTWQARLAVLAAERGPAEMQLAALREQVSAHQAAIVAAIGAARYVANSAVDPSVPLLGIPRLTPDQLRLWLAAKYGTSGRSVDADHLADVFVVEGLRYGVRGDIAFVQSAVETAGFRETGTNNFAGIGFCDSCARGQSFATPELGVRAQMQLLKAYATPGLTAADLPDPEVHGVDVETLSVRGCCHGWYGLTGVWATALHYGGTILHLYEEALALAGLPPA